MITIHAIMLVSLGFLCAVLLGLVIVPAYRKRVARLTRDQIKQAMPLTEAEIRADKDRLRADYAIVIHELDAKLDKRSLDVARQRVEINRRDAAISGLEGEVSRMRTSLDEHENARRVLEHTIMDRMPKVELRLFDARKLLTQRDREIAKLATSATKQSGALDEATQINAQNRDEIHRLNAALTTRAARSREGMGDGRFDGEVALRSEIEALRAKTRDQATLIARLQGLLERTGGVMAAGALAVGAKGGKSSMAGSSSGAGLSKSASPLGVYRSEDEIVRLRKDLGEAEAALRSANTSANEDKAGLGTIENELRVVKAHNEDQVAEIAKLKAALLSYQDDDADDRAIPDSKVAMSARISELTALSDERSSMVSRLRAEVAAGNEKLARQAMHFTDEMRRMGAGSMPMSIPKTGGSSVQRSAAAASKVSPMSDSAGEGDQQRRQLSDRIADPRQRQKTGGYGVLARVGGSSAPAASSVVIKDGANGQGQTPARAGAAFVKAVENGRRDSDPMMDRMSTGKAATDEGAEEAANAKSAQSSGSVEKVVEKRAPERRRQGGLIDRITRMDGSK